MLLPHIFFMLGDPLPDNEGTAWGVGAACMAVDRDPIGSVTVRRMLRLRMLPRMVRTMMLRR